MKKLIVYDSFSKLISEEMRSGRQKDCLKKGVYHSPIINRIGAASRGELSSCGTGCRLPNEPGATLRLPPAVNRRPFRALRAREHLQDCQRDF